MCTFSSHRWLSWPALTLASLLFAAGSSWAAPPGGHGHGHGASHGGGWNQGGGYPGGYYGYGRGYYYGGYPGYYGYGYGSPFFGYGAYPFFGALGSLGGYGYGGNRLGGYGGYGGGYGYSPSYDAGQSPPPPPLSNEEAMFLVVVPPNAEVWINGDKTSQTGPEREFASSGLTPGKTYTYEIRAHWMQGSQPVDRTLQVPIKGGERRLVNFLAPNPAAPGTP